MAVSSVTPTAATIGADYMKLLVTQLQNQNPLEPMDNNEMASQLAQLSSLDQLENMNRTFQEVLASQQRLQATALIGKQVAYLPEGATDVVTGRVEAVSVLDTGVRLTVGDSTIDLNAVQSIRD
ncbi:MAG TPA: flagellar hook capping FlgD N-terminal domain-containing protein [Phycisphaerae bacterium]|nr:flagellar hook capping FlgD N-terminal domain-containing protein [Phycisphaerae bacterium]